MDGYLALANAIIIQASKDYCAALRKLDKNPNDRKALDDADSFERFVHSQRFQGLTDIDGDSLIRGLKRNHKMWVKRS